MDDRPHQFLEHDGCRLLLHSLSFLDLVTLLRKQVVSKQFKELCSKAITAKCGKDGPKPHNNETLRKAVKTYHDIRYDSDSNKEDMEDITCKYGYPTDSWNVSQVTDIHWEVGRFKCENMNAMFENALELNQDIGRWDVSNMRNMDAMYCGARKFNQDIGKLNVSNVESKNVMFKNARTFKRRWDVSNVIFIKGMFFYVLCFIKDKALSNPFFMSGNLLQNKVAFENIMLR
ncbi:fibronectin domain containing protein [Nitzschia inconspicua]|uniref:Fibronectin domain containing protein n=1 Tax=Nitzschia inconspicua TaxID=303405 RepID=A0A9K3KUS7_9STRA|nr:fibronectin domain containing protein [Nitzschia inconspicua]